MKYVIFVKNREESEMVQKILFANGWAWDAGRTKEYRFEDAPFLYADTEKDGLGFGHNFIYAAKMIREKGYEPGSVESMPILPKRSDTEKMIEIGGKKWSESTIKEMIKRYANEDGDEFKEVRF